MDGVWCTPASAALAASSVGGSDILNPARIWLFNSIQLVELSLSLGSKQRSSAERARERSDGARKGESFAISSEIVRHGDLDAIADAERPEAGPRATGDPTFKENSLTKAGSARGRHGKTIPLGEEQKHPSRPLKYACEWFVASHLLLLSLILPTAKSNR